MHLLTDEIWFPEVSQASKEGLLAIGGDLSVERLVEAYKCGIFPWYNEDEPILWWSPNPRFVLHPERLKISKSMKKFMQCTTLRVTQNKAFSLVMHECSTVERSDQSGTWITSDMIDAYTKLHDLGYAKSVEVWNKDKLVGGLYGISINSRVFSGESMFSKADNASKFGLIKFVQSSSYQLIDCQVYTRHLASLGAENISRSKFINLLK